MFFFSKLKKKLFKESPLIISGTWFDTSAGQIEQRNMSESCKNYDFV